MNTFLFKGHKVRYFEAGAKNGDPIIFLHTESHDHRAWEFQLARFAKTHHVLATDHLGCGESDKPDIEYNLPLYSKMVGALVEEMPIGPVTLCGGSVGASMALHFAMLRPEKVRRLVLFNVATEKTLLAGPLGATCQAYSRNRDLIRREMSKIETQGLPRERTDSDLRAEYGESGVPDAPFAEHCHHLRNRPGVMRSLYNLYANWVSFRVLDEFSKPPGFPPILLFWGRSNRILPLAAGEELARRLKPDQFEIVDGCGQMVFREQPELVNKRTDDFLKRRIAMSPASAGAPTLERSPAAGA